MSLWISSTRETDRAFPPPPRGSAGHQNDVGRPLFAYVLIGLLGLITGLIIAQIAAEHHGRPSRIEWPAPALLGD